MLSITFVRHGNTDANQKRILQGQMDTILNERGHRQAVLVGERFANHPFDKVYCSDLVRCKQTAQAIQDNNHQDTPITYLSSLRERGFGDLSGQPLKFLFSESHRQNVNADDHVKTHGGETEKEFATRVIDGYIAVVKEAVKADYRHILIVTHGGPLRSLCLWWTTRLSPAYHYDGDLDRLQRGHHGNTGVTRIRLDQGDPMQGVVELFSCLDHLKSLGSIDEKDMPPSV